LRGDELVSAFRFAEIPDADVAAAVSGDKFTLIGVDDDVVYRVGVWVVALHDARAGVPDFDGHVLGGGDHPFPFAVEGYAGDIIGVAFKCDDRVRVSRFDVVEFDVVSTGGGEIFLVGRDT
jgi:hypothetical protein